MPVKITKTNRMYGNDLFATADASYVLNLALQDGVTELYINKHHYDTIRNFMAYCGAWNWDKKTFMGMNLIIEDEK